MFSEIMEAFYDYGKPILLDFTTPVRIIYENYYAMN